jgi:DNA repair photolyase
MTEGLRHRIEKLEASKDRQRNGLFVAPIYPGETEEEAMRLAGVPADADTVVFIRRFSVSRQDDKGRRGGAA